MRPQARAYLCACLAVLFWSTMATAFKIALTLDPTLGDPAYNPQAANNERLLAVKMLLYREQVGTLGLPLSDVEGGELDDSRPVGED